jgi:hypothetical protein
LLSAELMLFCEASPAVAEYRRRFIGRMQGLEPRILSAKRKLEVNHCDAADGDM